MLYTVFFVKYLYTLFGDIDEEIMNLSMTVTQSFQTNYINEKNRKKVYQRKHNNSFVHKY